MYHDMRSFPCYQEDTDRACSSAGVHVQKTKVFGYVNLRGNVCFPGKHVGEWDCVWYQDSADHGLPGYSQYL